MHQNICIFDISVDGTCFVNLFKANNHIFENLGRFLKRKYLFLHSMLIFIEVSFVAVFQEHEKAIILNKIIKYFDDVGRIHRFEKVYLSVDSIFIILTLFERGEGNKFHCVLFFVCVLDKNNLAVGSTSQSFLAFELVHELIIIERNFYLGLLSQS